MTDVMNSCDSAVGDYNVSGASEEQNISLQVGLHSFGSLKERQYIKLLFATKKKKKQRKRKWMDMKY